MTTNKRLIGQENRFKTLAILTRLGYATTRQVAMTLFGSCTASSRQMAGRTIRWLLDRGYVVERRDCMSVAGERMIALTRSGAQAIEASATLPLGRGHARDWLRHAHSHRTAANSVFCSVARSLDEDPGFSELEIRAGEAPPALSAFSYTCQGEAVRKVPDLLLHGSDGEAPIWVEVENTCRSARDLERVVAFLRCVFVRPQPPVSKVWFVITSPSASRVWHRLQAAMTHAPGSGESRLVRELDARILAERVVVLNLDPERLELSRV